MKIKLFSVEANLIGMTELVKIYNSLWNSIVKLKLCKILIPFKKDIQGLLEPTEAIKMIFIQSELQVVDKN